MLLLHMFPPLEAGGQVPACSAKPTRHGPLLMPLDLDLLFLLPFVHPNQALSQELRLKPISLMESTPDLITLSLSGPWHLESVYAAHNKLYSKVCHLMK